jgi:hypothetical protein
LTLQCFAQATTCSDPEGSISDLPEGLRIVSPAKSHSAQWLKYVARNWMTKKPLQKTLQMAAS